MLQSAAIPEPLHITLVGNPNCGKTSLFNALTGLNQKVGNFPGVTVEQKTGTIQFQGKKAFITDLPGIYSLSPSSEDERVAAEYIAQAPTSELFLVVADATQLKRSLLLCTQLIDARKKVILVLNMMDMVQKNHIHMNLDKLAQELGVPVIPANARLGRGVEEIKKGITSFVYTYKPFLQQPDNTEDLTDRLKIIATLYNEVVKPYGETHESLFTRKLDAYLTHPFWGYTSFLLLMFLIFQAVFFWAQYPMEWIEAGFSLLTETLENILPEGLFSDLLTEGILAGLSGVLVFIPQIAILFAFIALLEDTGYMARVSFIMDKLLRPFGLNGRSVVPLLSGTACAVPSIMSARTIANPKERLITIFVTPLVSCSARIPVYTLLIALCIPAEKTLGPFNLQGIIMMGLYMMGFVAALLTALIMKILLKQKEKSYFIMEMPIYRPPRWASVGMEMFSKVKVFVWEAGRIIVAISIVLWALSSYAPGNSFDELEEKYASESFAHLSEEEAATLLAGEKLEQSYAGRLGKWIEPAIAPLGFNWKTGIALITSFAAREVFVGTMATLYSIGDADNTLSIREKMQQSRNLQTGEKEYTLATCMALLVFYVFAMQCMATLAVVKRETASWKWPFLQVVYMGALAWISAFAIYQILQ